MKLVILFISFLTCVFAEKSGNPKSHAKIEEVALKRETFFYQSDSSYNNNVKFFFNKKEYSLKFNKKSENVTIFLNEKKLFFEDLNDFYNIDKKIDISMNDSYKIVVCKTKKRNYIIVSFSANNFNKKNFVYYFVLDITNEKENIIYGIFNFMTPLNTFGDYNNDGYLDFLISINDYNNKYIKEKYKIKEKYCILANVFTIKNNKISKIDTNNNQKNDVFIVKANFIESVAELQYFE
ncbi:hypothetical protein [Hugenholtzia roseola]|uniref:hypothetical protein n=1 Tax=Hugenholtzia roseola TaxID=1002 RepID=UPI000400B35E|nr:hypothetical protein [Hugenholtzia roseola]